MLYVKVVKIVNLRILITREKIFFYFFSLYVYDMMDVF